MATPKTIPRRLLDGWTAIAGRFGFVQTLMLLVVLYILVFGPFWLVTSLARRDFLNKRGLRAEGTAWADADTAEPGLERAKLLS
jgi:hypothetical protein